MMSRHFRQVRTHNVIDVRRVALKFGDQTVFDYTIRALTSKNDLRLRQLSPYTGHKYI